MRNRLELFTDIFFTVMMGVLALLCTIILTLGLTTLITGNPTPPSQKMECECSTSN